MWSRGHDIAGIELLGIMFQSFATACTNLRIVLGAEAAALSDGIEREAWYPLARYYRLAELVSAAYTDPVSILERIGADTAALLHGRDRSAMTCGADFLRRASTPAGYHAIIRGPADAIGTVELELLDEAAGRARIRSTTLIPRDLEKGVLYGGLRLLGDITFVQIDNARDPDVFEIEFH